MGTATIKTVGGDVAVELPISPGRKADTASKSVTLSNEDKAALDLVAAKLESIKGFTDTLEALNITLNGYVDGLESLAANTNTLLAAQATYLDGLEALAGAAIPAGEAHIGEVGGRSIVAGSTITRPSDTTAYTIDDLVSFNTVAASVSGVNATSFVAARKNGGTGIIRRVRLSTNKSAGIAGTEVFRVHLFKNAPTVTNGDNGVFAVDGVTSLYMGYVDVTLSSMFGANGAKGFAMVDIVFDAAAGSDKLYYLLQARSTYTPASGEIFTVAFEILQD